SIIWWFTYLAAEPIFLKVHPSLYNRLKEEGREKRLIPFILFFMRIFYGLLITFPTCTYAALTAPWGHGVPLNRAGEICMASQVTVWSTELGLLLPFSFELFLHHIVCLVVTANVVWSPAVHPIRPIYILFATQLGDLPPCGILLLKMTVRDWIWVFCLLFWVAYCILTVYKNLRWLRVINSNPLRPYSLVVCDRLHVSTSRLVLGFGFGMTLLSTLFLYGLNLETPLTEPDLKALAVLGALGAAVGLTSAMGLRALLPVKAPQTEPWGRDIYLHYAMFIVGWWACSGTASAPGIDPTTLMASLALNVPLHQGVSKLSHYISAKDAATYYIWPDLEPSDEKPIPAAPAMAQLPEDIFKEHIGTSQASFTMYFISVALLSFDYLNSTEAGSLALGATLLSQLLRSPRMIYDSLTDTFSLAPFLHALLSCVGVVLGLIILIYDVSSRQNRIQDSANTSTSISWALMMGTTILAGFAVEFILKPKKTLWNKREKRELLTAKAKKKRGGILSPSSLTCIALFNAQIIIGAEVIRYSGAEPEAKPGIGFANFMKILKSPTVWTAVMAAGIMPNLLL
ncbi:hypothetical protein BGZ63DRAFT_336570, partial [Mariannaea sp. PMI_226]